MQPKGKTGSAEVVLNLINKLHGVEWNLNTVSDEARRAGRHECSVPLLVKLKSGWKRLPPVTTQNALGNVINSLASNGIKLERYVEDGFLPVDNNAAEAPSAPS